MFSVVVRREALVGKVTHRGSEGPHAGPVVGTAARIAQPGDLHASLGLYILNRCMKCMLGFRLAH